jgi:hypothetical protein
MLGGKKPVTMNEQQAIEFGRRSRAKASGEVLAAEMGRPETVLAGGKERGEQRGRSLKTTSPSGGKGIREWVTLHAFLDETRVISAAVAGPEPSPIRA